MNLDALEWEVLPPLPASEQDGLPFATHSGILQLGDLKIKVYQLNNGQRVIDEKDLDKLFGLTPK